MVGLESRLETVYVSGDRMIDREDYRKSMRPLQLLKQDLLRYNDLRCKPGTIAYWKHIIRQGYTHPGMLAVIVYRYGGWVRTFRIPVAKQILDAHYQYLYNCIRFKLQIEIPRDTIIGPGLRVDHYGGILMNSQAIIGRNFTASQGLLLGQTETGAPVIGDDINCGVGVKIIGNVRLGSCMKIGAGSVVTKSFEGKMIIAGVPAKVLRPLLRAPEANGWIPPIDWVPSPNEEYASD